MFNSNAVSAAKALGIIFMVIGHASCPRHLFGYIFAFHMPLFFILSGYCFKMKYLDDAKTFVKRRFTGIWWPYVKWSLVFIALHNIFCCINIYNDHYYTWQEFLKNGVNTLRFVRGEPLLTGFWFLQELFWASLLGYASIKYLRKFKLSGGVFLTIIAIYYFTGKNYHIPIIDLSGRTWMATFFFLFGHAWRENEERGGFLAKYYALNVGRKIAVVAALAIIVEICAHFAGSLSMKYYTVGGAPFLFLLAGICGTLMVYYICCWIVSNPESKVTQFLTFTGRHTFEVLTWHIPCFKIVSLMIIGLYALDIELLLPCHPGIHTSDLQAAGIDVSWTLWWVAYTIVGAGVPILWQYVRMKQGKERRRY